MVPRPMLARGAYKFHLRVMVLAVGDLKVYVHEHAVAGWSRLKPTLKAAGYKTKRLKL
jgi:hypothetical protein